jgi:hypothetical protein
VISSFRHFRDRVLIETRRVETAPGPSVRNIAYISYLGWPMEQDSNHSSRAREARLFDVRGDIMRPDAKCPIATC